jgi:hypothetical protein
VRRKRGIHALGELAVTSIVHDICSADFEIIKEVSSLTDMSFGCVVEN